MKNLSGGQLAALADAGTALATIWQITRTDAVVLQLTDLDVELDVEGDTYLPGGSTERTSIKLSDGLAADNLDISGIVASDLIADADLRAGLYDYAEVLVGLAFVGEALPPIWLGSGTMGEVQLDNGGYTVAFNGLTQALAAAIGEATSPNCRADFGDARCQASLTTWRHTYTLASVTDARTLVLTGPSLLAGAETYAGGVLEVMSGPAVGLRMEVKTLATLTLGLYLPLATLPEAGDTVRVTVGCDKLRATCRGVFANIINFQGEPDVPGIDALAAPPVG